MGLFETLTVPARQALAAATELAAEMGSHEVEGAHLLVGLLDTPSAAQGELAAVLTDRDAVVSEVQRVTLPSTGGGRPVLGVEVCEALAAARGISAGRGVPATGSVAVARGLLLLLPRSVEELLAHHRVDHADLGRSLAGLDDATEPTATPGAAPWTVRIASGDADGWSDTP